MAGWTSVDTAGRRRGFVAGFLVEGLGCLGLLLPGMAGISLAAPVGALAIASLGAVAGLVAPGLLGLFGAVSGGWLLLIGPALASALAAGIGTEAMVDAVLEATLLIGLIPLLIAPGFGIGVALRPTMSRWRRFAPRWRDGSQARRPRPRSPRLD